MTIRLMKAQSPKPLLFREVVLLTLILGMAYEIDMADGKDNDISYRNNPADDVDLTDSK